MPAARVQVVAHPGAGRGAFARRWPAVEAELRAAGIDHDVHLTSGAGQTGAIARSAADDGARLIVVVGGDGTLHEAVNGLLSGRTSLPDETAVGLVAAGRGSDYARGLGLPRDAAAIVAMFRAFLDGDPAASKRVDAGEVTYTPSATVAGRAAATQEPREPRDVRRFVNGAGIGFSPFVAQRTARFPARLGAYLYTAAGLLTIVDWHDRLLHLTWDDGTAERAAVESLELALGPFEGGGMRVAPDADVTDGLFDAVLIGAVSRAEMLTFAWRIRSGAHLTSPRVRVRRTASVDVSVADARGPMYLQADGELLGRDPFRFSVLRSALRCVC